MKILEIKILNAKSENVKARADIHFDGFTLNGFKVILNSETHKEYVTPPSYKSFKGWRMLFKTDDEEDWNEIQRRVLEEYGHHLIDESVPEREEI